MSTLFEKEGRRAKRGGEISTTPFFITDEALRGVDWILHQMFGETADEIVFYAPM